LKNVVLGGRHAISYKVGLIFLPFLIVSIPLTERDITHKLFIQWTIVSSLSLLLTTIVLVVCDKTFLRNRFETPISNIALFLFGGFIGAVRGMATFAFARWIFHIPSNTLQSGLIRTGNAALLGGLSFTLIALISFSYQEIARSRKESLANLVAIDELLGTTRDQENQEELISAVAARLLGMHNQIRVLAVAQNLPEKEELAGVLRKLSTDLVRPLSHQVAKLEKSQSKPFKESMNVVLLIPDALFRQIPWIILTHIFGEFRGDLQIFGLHRGLILILLNNIILGLLLLGLSRLFRYSKASISRVFGFPILIGVAQALSTGFVIRNFDQRYSFSSFLVEATWTSLVIGAISFAGAYLNTSIEAIEISKSQYLRKFKSVTFQRYTNSNISHDLARFLHGSLQTKLSTSALRVLQAKSDEELRTELLIAADYLKMPEVLLHADANKSFVERLQEIKDSWEPLIQMKFSAIAFNSDIDSVALGNLLDLINEATSNAHRHGGASTISFTIKNGADSILVEATNDGILVESFKPGLGSHIYDIATQKNWELINRETQTTLIAKIPVQLHIF